MEDKIEVGEYVRVDKNKRFLGIGKIIGIVSDTIYLKMHIDLPISFSLEEIKEYKHSKNIIDIIEVGDYVNGYKVISVDYDVINNNIDCIELDLNNNYQYNFISINQVKSIVTKEQFESICYRLEGAR